MTALPHPTITQRPGGPTNENYSGMLAHDDMKRTHACVVMPICPCTFSPRSGDSTLITRKMLAIRLHKHPRTSYKIEQDSTGYTGLGSVHYLVASREAENSSCSVVLSPHLCFLRPFIGFLSCCQQLSLSAYYASSSSCSSPASHVAVGEERQGSSTTPAATSLASH